ncbi:MAG: matrixin family metalloprotease, partial [Nitrosopumilaceae archaeon]|nr:matrixin family metalloprotease [Nitrosopumilaceae archaeon]
QSITEIKVELEESTNLIKSLNSQIVDYENQLSTLKQENSKYRNEISILNTEKNQSPIGNQDNPNDELVKILSEEINQYENNLQELKEENKLLQKKANLASSENADKLILITEIESENREMKKQVELLKDELNKKQEKITTLSDLNSQKDSKISSLQAQKSSSLEKLKPSKVEASTKTNENLLVELNYLKAKSLVNEEEIDILRAENEEYRVLLNLLKKGQNSVTGLDKTDYDTMNDGQGVVVYKKDTVERSLPSDWVQRVNNDKEYLIYIEPTPRWASDMTEEVNAALDFWKETAGVEFEIVQSPSFGTISIDWEKELRNGYDGYVVGETDVTIGLGSSECDGTWKPYNSESIKDILIHELGHTVGLDHAVSKSNIMYPMIHNAKFDGIKQTITIPSGGSVFVKGCSFSADPTYKYNVEVQDYKQVDIFFIPSVNEKYKVDSGDSFDYYSDINCLGIQKSSKSGTCQVADSGGMLVVNSGNESVVASLYLEER